MSRTMGCRSEAVTDAEIRGLRAAAAAAGDLAQVAQCAHALAGYRLARLGCVAVLTDAIAARDDLASEAATLAYLAAWQEDARTAKTTPDEVADVAAGVVLEAARGGVYLAESTVRRLLQRRVDRLTRAEPRPALTP